MMAFLTLPQSHQESNSFSNEEKKSTSVCQSFCNLYFENFLDVIICQNLLVLHIKRFALFFVKL